MSDRLFDPEMIEAFARRFEQHGEYSLPASIRLAREPRLERERQRLEAIFATIPAEHRATLRADIIREKNEGKHQGALFELEAWNYFYQRPEWGAVFQPDSDIGNPDLLVTAPNSSEYYVEVLTANPDDEASQRKRHERRFFDVLDQLTHRLYVYVTAISVTPVANEREFRRFVVQELDRLVTDGVADKPTDEPLELQFNGEGAVVVLAVSSTGRTEAGLVFGGHSGPVRSLPPTPFVDRMEKKLKRYSKAREEGRGLLLAVGIADTAFAYEGLPQSMYGPVQFSFPVGPGAASGAPGKMTHKFEDGLLLDDKGRPRWPYFGGALQIIRYWDGVDVPEIVVPAVGFVRNVWSDRTPEPKWFGDIPQWGLPGPNADTMVGSWAKWRDGRVVEANRGESG